MADVFSSEKRSEIMSKIKGKNTKPEMIVRKFLYSKGLRYRLHNKNLPGKPDITISRFRTIIQIHGCFWHGHDPCAIQQRPKSNNGYWNPKIEMNIARDARNEELLKGLGWRVITIWECEIYKKGHISMLEKIYTLIIS